MSFEPVRGKGTLIKLNGTSIPARITISGPSIEQGTTDITTLDDDWEVVLTTIKKTGALQFQLLFDPLDTAQQGVTALIYGPSEDNTGTWTLVFANSGATEIEFDGPLTKAEPAGFEVEGKAVLNCEAKPSGEVTLTP